MSKMILNSQVWTPDSGDYQHCWFHGNVKFTNTVLIQSLPPHESAKKKVNTSKQFYFIICVSKG